MGSFITKKAISRYMLTGQKDCYNGITIKSEELGHVRQKEAREILKLSLDNWEKTDVEGIWFMVNVKDAWWITILLDAGFIFHHTTPDYILLTKWLLPTANCLPKYAFTYAGACGLVINSRGEVLMMRERRGHYLGWKFPGGATDYGEPIHETAVREVREETGVEAEFVTVLAIKQTMPIFFKNASSIYFYCVLKPTDENAPLNPCPNETAGCQWMSRAQLDALPESEFRWFYREFLLQYDVWFLSKRRGCFYTEMTRKSGGPSDLKHNETDKSSDSTEAEANVLYDRMSAKTPSSVCPDVVKGIYFFD